MSSKTRIVHVFYVLKNTYVFVRVCIRTPCSSFGAPLGRRRRRRRCCYCCCYSYMYYLWNIPVIKCKCLLWSIPATTGQKIFEYRITVSSYDVHGTRCPDSGCGPSDRALNCTHDIDIFTALYVMQTRYSEENSVCPSVCPSVRLSVRPSHAWSLTKWKKDRSRFLYHTKEHLA